MLDALADFAANRMQIAEFEINSGGMHRRYKYRSVSELRDGIAFAKTMMDDESGNVPGRTYARNGGGRW